MVKTISISLIVFVLIGLLIYARQSYVIAQAVKRGNYNQPPYERLLDNPRLKFLFLGDSTGVGTGAKTPQGSTAGYFAKDFPEAQIINRARNGNKVRGLLMDFPNVPSGPYDLIVAQIGANDIIRLTPYKQLEEDLIKVLTSLKKMGRHVVVLHSGNIGAAPIFRWPLNWIITQRTRTVRDMYIRHSQRLGVIYVDLFEERSDDHFLNNKNAFYSADEFHPSEIGYKFWYEQIRQSLDRAGIEIGKTS